MKIARRKRAQAGTGCLNPGDAKSASRTRLNQFSAGYFRRAQREIARKNPRQKAARNSCPFRTALVYRVIAYRSTRRRLGVWSSGATAVLVGMIAFLSAQSKGDFRPKVNFEQKLIYISQVDIRVKTCYTITDEKNSGDYLIPRNVRWRFRQFDDVESAKRRLC